MGNCSFLWQFSDNQIKVTLLWDGAQWCWMSFWSYKVINASCVKGDSIEHRENNHWGISKSLLAKITKEDRISTDFSKLSLQSLGCKSQTFWPNGDKNSFYFYHIFCNRILGEIVQNYVRDLIKPSEGFIQNREGRESCRKCSFLPWSGR